MKKCPEQLYLNTDTFSFLSLLTRWRELLKPAFIFSFLRDIKRRIE